jgi:CheY-like chemotaxis protein/nitrogen-specific signal transduction histidine kinase
VELMVTEGERSWSWLCNFAPIRDVEGRMHGASVVVQDITPFKRVEASLREADHQKDDFLAILGHELRNPIAAIRSATELLGRIESASPQLLRLYGIFERQTQQTTKLIDGLLDVARVARGKVELELAPVPIARVLRQVIDDHQQQFRERVVDCHLPDEELWVQADRARLMQVFDNLLSNALKFTAANGRIGITLTHAAEHGAIQVDDDGAGIEPELLPHIFEPFRQGRPRSAGHAGLGLGLALVKGLVDLHGFGLSAVSEGRGRGASFRIEFPLAVAPDSPAPPSRVDTRPLELLLVEDNVDIAETLAELLIAAGHQVQTLATAEEALSVLRERRPDVVLCDIGLPGMSGLELATRLRADADPERAALKLVALTGYGDAQTQGRIAGAGFDRTLIKPVQLDALRHCLARVVAAPASQPELAREEQSG